MGEVGEVGEAIVGARVEGDAEGEGRAWGGRMVDEGKVEGVGLAEREAVE